MLKIQTLDNDLGWVFATRTGPMPGAWSELAAYRRNWPSEQYRLVEQCDDGSVTVIPDDIKALEAAEAAYQADCEADEMAADWPALMGEIKAFRSMLIFSKRRLFDLVIRPKVNGALVSYPDAFYLITRGHFERAKETVLKST